ncbi:MAG: tetratricopeptide repeat protein [Desulfobacteraceae bacterium]
MDKYVFHISIALCLILFFYLRKSAGSNKNENLRKLAFAKAINDYETTSHYLIKKSFSSKDAAKMNGGSKIIDDQGLRLCKDKLNDSSVISNPKLHFYILMKISKFLIIQYHFNKAIHYLEEAVKIESENVVALLFLAEASEYSGNKEKAVKAYNSIIKIGENAVGVKDFVDIQLARIEKQGLKKPMQLGLKYMSY